MHGDARVGEEQLEALALVHRVAERLADWSGLQPRRNTGSVGRLRRYVRESGVAKKGACHLFRHAMATSMLEGGVDVRYVQEMLGHTKLETTAIYTQVSITKLKEVYLATHPTARLGRPKASSEGKGAAVEDAAELLADLEKDAEDEVQSGFDAPAATE